jgi:hypothetical protein
MGTGIVSLLESGVSGTGGGLVFKGDIAVASDFPTLAEVRPGWWFEVVANVTDNDPTKTNTNKSFSADDQIVWNGTTWKDITGTEVWGDDGIDVQTVNDPRNLDLQNGGLKDVDVTVAINFGSPTATALTTVEKSVIGGINEVNGKIPLRTVNSSDPLNPFFFAGLEIDSDGKTAFTISTTPLTSSSIDVYLNGVLAPITDYTIIGTALSWGGVALVSPPSSGDPDEFLVIINTDSTGVPPVKSYLEQADLSSNYDTRRVRSIGSTGSFRLNFRVPLHFTGTLSLFLIGYPESGAGGPAKDIDFSGEYTNAAGASNTQFTVLNTTSTYNTGTDDTRMELNITFLVPNLAPGSEGALLVDHKTLTGPINYLGIEARST